MAVDSLKLMLGMDIKVNDFITIKQPSIIDIAEYGEQKYYGMISTLIATPADLKSLLWDKYKIDWCKISEFEVFMMFCPNFTPNETGILLGDLDLSLFKSIKNEETSEIFLYDELHNYEIHEQDYQMLMDYISGMHGLKRVNKKAKNKYTWKILLEVDRNDKILAASKPYVSQLKNLLSGMLAYPGFKYKRSELNECAIYEFMDTIQRAQIFVSSNALLHGIYGGMIDGSKLKKDCNWLRDIK